MGGKVYYLHENYMAHLKLHKEVIWGVREGEKGKEGKDEEKGREGKGREGKGEWSGVLLLLECRVEA